MTRQRSVLSALVLILIGLMAGPALAEFDPEIPVSEIPWEEFRQRLTLQVPDDYVVPPPDPMVETMTFRSSFDLRDEGGCTPVRNQGGCGSCWAFGQTAAFESRIMVTSGMSLNLSEQQQVDCNTHGYGCDGGWLDSYNIWVSYGACSESDYPYEADDGNCRQGQHTPVVHADGGRSISNTVNSIKNALQNHGGVASAITVNDSFQNYSGGCFTYSNPGSVNHAVLIMGWDDSMCSGSGAWIIKNSWGTNWGEGGYGYVQYGHASLGYGAMVVDYTPNFAPNLRYATHQINDSDGNDDGLIDPGESILMPLALYNSGNVDATDVVGELTTASSYITVVDGDGQWGDLPAGEGAGTQGNHFRFSVSASTPEGTRIPFQLDISCAEGEFEAEFSVVVGRTVDIFTDGFEGGDNGWTHAQIATQDDWQRRVPQGTSSWDPPSAHGGSQVWGNDMGGTFEGSQWDGDYKNDVHNYLQSPPIDCSGYRGVALSFYRWLSVEEHQYDQATLKVNGTTVWTNGNSDHVDSSWQQVEYDISEIADGNPSVVIRFELQTDPGVVFGGWNIDDLVVSGTVEGAAPTATPAGPTATPTPPTTTPTPAPTATPAPADHVTLTLFINDALFQGGDRLRLDLEVRSPEMARTADLYAALEIYGSYYFFPAWDLEPTGVRLVLSPDDLFLVPILDVDLPDSLPEAGPFTFYSLTTDADTFDLCSNLASVAFRFGS